MGMQDGKGWEGWELGYIWDWGKGPEGPAGNRDGCWELMLWDYGWYMVEKDQ